MTIWDLKEKIISEMRDGLCQPNSDNPILFTMEFYALLHELGMFDEKDKQRLHDAIKAVAMRDKEGKIIPGLYTRRAGTDDDWVRKDQHDNYTAICSSRIFGKEFIKYAKEIVEYGRKTFYSYDNRAPFRFSVHSFKSLLLGFFKAPSKENLISVGQTFECWRQGWNVFFYKSCADMFHFYNLHNYVWFMGKIWTEYKFKYSKPEHTSSRLLSWLRMKAIGDKWYMKLVSGYWQRKLDGMYKNGITDVFEIYHGASSDLYLLATYLTKEEKA